VRIGAAALGWSLGIGRLGAVSAPTVLGLLVGSALGLGWNFYAIAICECADGAVRQFAATFPPASVGGPPASARFAGASDAREAVGPREILQISTCRMPQLGQ
jgi:MFS transporter, AAHS family, benzoate transport protein